jgi:uncharacterized protein (TIGR02246 family)
MMKHLYWVIFFAFFGHSAGSAQEALAEAQRQAVIGVVDQYEQAREARDTALLRRILTGDVDQLVSSGSWRRGIGAAVEGMLRSSDANPGERSIEVEQVRFLHPACAVADARYEIRNADGSVRRMWSTFIVVNYGGHWKIAAIRNMLPAGSR